MFMEEFASLVLNTIFLFLQLTQFEFLEQHITSKYRNKLIIIDNASSHRNPKVKELINKDNHLLYVVPYQHFTNSIENYFSMLKSRLQKLDGLTHGELKKNIMKTIKSIPKEKYRNIIKGAYERPEKYVSKKNKTRKIKKNNFHFLKNYSKYISSV